MSESKYISLHYEKDTPIFLRSTLKNSIEDVMNKSKNKEMFKGLSIHLVDDYSDVQSKSLFGDFANSRKGHGPAGFTMNPIFLEGEKEIAINTDNTVPSWKNLFGLIKDSNLTETEIKEVFLHELGHQFNTYYSSVKLDENLINITKNYLNNQISKKEFEEITKEYFNSELSDSNDFKKAWIKDVDEFKNVDDLFELYCDLGYFVPDWFVTRDKDFNNDIDFFDGIDDKEVEFASKERNEVFAQIFAYLLGADNDPVQKEAVLSSYPNCTECVKEFMQKHLGIQF